MKQIVLFLTVIFLLEKVESTTTNTVKYFEHLTYDVKVVKNDHHRSRRSVSETGVKKPFHLQFTAHDQHFDLLLVHDTTGFSDDFGMEDHNGHPIDNDLSHLYGGTIYGVADSYVHGTVIDGIFRGTIYHPDKGAFYVEESHLFFGPHTGMSPVFGYRGHSVIYRHEDVKFPERHHSHHDSAFTCGHSDKAIHESMDVSSMNVTADDDEELLTRNRRAVSDPDKTTCLLFIQTDWILYREYSDSGDGARDIIVSKIADHVRAINKIYHSTNFEGIKNIGFLVKRIRVNKTREASGNYFRQENVGVESFLNYASMENFNDYCLAYVFTSRDFDKGVLGLAWVADAGHKNGGICEKYKMQNQGGWKSLNTGIVTFKNYGNLMATPVSHITFAHEVGHNFGSPHDDGAKCSPGDNYGRRGNYIMYARATNGDKPNNKLFSPCSIGNMSAVLRARKDVCFVGANFKICGNGIIDDGEQCDCGFSEDCAAQGDSCCVPAGKSDPDECKLVKGTECSPSQGPCCDAATCSFHLTSKMCRNFTDCRQISNCSGTEAVCKPGPPKVAPMNNTRLNCAFDTKLCDEGECTASRCTLHAGYDACECTVPKDKDGKDLLEKREDLCNTCCRKGSGECSRIDLLFGGDPIVLQPGSPCDNNNGYCDVFSKCRNVDADGPLARVRDALFNAELYDDIRQWIVAYWWACALMALALILLMVGFVKLCSVHTPTSNPSLPKHRQLPGAGTIRRHRQQYQQRQGQRRQGRSTVDVEMRQQQRRR